VKAKHKRLMYIVIMLCSLGGGVYLVTSTLNDNLVFYFTPTDILTRPNIAQANKKFRLGGMVEDGSLETLGNANYRFKVTDTVNFNTVEYHGVLPDLFREGQGVVAEGNFGKNGVFIAEKILAKHDENYMPPEVAKKMHKIKNTGAE
jgi:cytochrome c-type biogenesis protein CcmE